MSVLSWRNASYCEPSLITSSQLFTILDAVLHTCHYMWAIRISYGRNVNVSFLQVFHKCCDIYNVCIVIILSYKALVHTQPVLYCTTRHAFYIF